VMTNRQVGSSSNRACVNTVVQPKVGSGSTPPP
jgi:hypothetical protein